MSRIYWDTMLFIYYLEDHPLYAGRVLQIYDRMQERGDQLFTSSAAVAEVLVGPKKKGDHELVEKVREFFASQEVSVLPFDVSTTEIYSDLRASRKLSVPDAIHLACAAKASVDLFITHDHRLRKTDVPGIGFLVGLETDLL